MSAKPEIISRLGEKDLLLPHLIEDALRANERLKMHFTVLQAAQRHADHPQEPVQSLAPEQQAGLLDIALADTVSGSRREPDGALYIPGARSLRERILADLATMRAPLEQAGIAQAPQLAARELRLVADLPALEADRVPGDLIGRLTAVARPGAEAPDSLHALVMDLHRALNTLQGTLAQEVLDGARVWRIEETDRSLVRAFMSGVNRTAALKFDHPGLGTTATRAAGRLIIQNDIGETESHILVLHVEGKEVTLTYTDVHAQRLAFLESMLEPFSPRWTRSSAQPDAGLPGGYLLAIGRFAATDQATLERYLAFLGSRIVFLIDWNRARKRLQSFLDKPAVSRLLKWAADRDIGHRGFLAAGGERLLYEAIEFAQERPFHYGERLDETLGAESAFEYLKFVLEQASTGLLQGRSERFIRDEIKAELARRFRTAHVNLLTIGLEHVEGVFDLATAVHQALLRCGEPDGRAFLARTAVRARRWEQECDALVARMHAMARRTAKFEVYAVLMHEADEAADGLEEAAFLATHLGALAAPRAVLESLQGLAQLLVVAAQESIKMFEAASYVTRDGAREDLRDFFAAADRVAALEHSTDAAERAVTGRLLEGVADARLLFLVSNLSRALEHAADALSVTALKLRDHLLSEISGP
jgi:uncharacterized protein Yka (UPF0111/DUF47 family)